ncbi:unnamed protein product [Tilletia controversa]|uniref:Ketoreductase domain-containing protein n=3 Tax=Tilletia TaxID=13289 RepID=A0A8X7SYK6_9BASI|nr:hypothetical protein CF336_g795 [Tilletia laevis]KAE8204712.1 hypothetical protein CF328_g932 [Tilletia controversa]KAE8261895.1 hypothetical protein A4X03_0g2886 [Tilletia caries]KAE8205831.1 hypothetical protein CF335_g2176 [Tilletia laevis]KAE8251222.1 hypothetical protein A4X06_0g2769 [Tilletia controversa]
MSSSSRAQEEQNKALAQTKARIELLRSQLAQQPRAGRLAGKVAILTGVGSLLGIGRATAFQFAHQRASHLYLTDLDDENLGNLKDELNKAYPDVKVTVQACDAADEQAVKSLCDRAISETGQLDIFFANAGVATGAPLHQTDTEDVDRVFRINTVSCFHALKYASLAMKVLNSEGGKTMSGGSIIMTSSIAGLRSGGGSVEYSASKAAVVSLAQTGAWQLARTGIRVNAICPGLIETGMTAPVFEMARDRGAEGKIGQLNPTGRYGIASEIAYAVTFLASDEASYVNGVALAVDGGLSASHPIVPGKSY